MLLGIVFVLFWLVTVRQAVTGQLGGTFTHHAIPTEYEVLKDLISQPEYFRTFWVPRWQRYGFSSYMHPAVDAAAVLDTGSPSAILNWLDSKEGMEALSRWSVKYVILPYDSQGEIFLEDRKYSGSQKGEFETVLDANRFLVKKQIPGLTANMSAYETGQYYDHLRLEENAAALSWDMISPVRYRVSISGLSKPDQIIFSESYDSYWLLTIEDKTYRSEKANNGINSFSIPAVGTANGTLEYLPQRYVWIGLGISIVTICCATIIIWNQRKYR